MVSTLQLLAIAAVCAASSMAQQKTVSIRISPQDLTILKGSGYRMCFAKKVGHTYNVIWQSYTEYLGNNEFSWTPEYQLFGTNTFNPGVIVQVQTNLVNINLTQSATLDSAGNLGDAKSGGGQDSFVLINNYGSIHAGVNQVSTGIDGVRTSTPIFVGDTIVMGPDALTPKDTVKVWFERNVETGTIIDDAQSFGAEIDLTHKPSATFTYTNQIWTEI